MRLSVASFAFVAITILAVIGVLWGGGASPVERAADRLLGERWYRVTVHGDSVGAYMSRGLRGDEGYRFETDLRFRLGGGAEVHIADALAFDPGPDYRLRRATHAYESGDTTLRTTVERRGDMLEAVVADGERRALSWDYRLADYVLLEAWLGRGREPPARVLTRSLDLGELRIEREIWQVVERNRAGYRLRQSSVAGDNEVLLDAELVPVRFDLAGVFSMERVAGPDEALAWRSAPAADMRARHAVSLDIPLDAPHALTGLTLRVRTDRTLDASAWPALSPDGNGGWLLTGRGDVRARAEHHEMVELSRPTPSLPADDPDVVRLAESAVRGSRSRQEEVDALVDFVYAHLEYAERDGAQSVADTLRDRRGDCTEYAALLTTLARARGFPARTVTGLAYDAEAGTFALHSWNEIAVEGHWRGVDPTWAQTRIDATHIPIPDERSLEVMGLLPQVAFELVATEY